MATTIQIKRGTGSAVPSGLADGELAINLDNGKLFFGSSSTSINSFRFENLTAENYIVSSSVTNIITQTLSGSTAFGNSADDTHQFTGSITASGNISSTGNISASGNLLGGGITVNGNSTFNSNVITLGVDSGDRINLNADIVTSATFLGNITASSNISASGDIIGQNFTSHDVISTSFTGSVDNPAIRFGPLAGNLSGNKVGLMSEEVVPGSTFFVPYFVANGAKIFGFGTIMDMQATIQMNGNAITFDGDATNTFIKSDLSTPENLEVHADGNIELRADDNLQIFSNTEIAVQTGSANHIFLNINGEITASGNISSSGTITAATLDAAAVSDTLAAAIVAEIDNDEIPIAKLAEDAVTVTAGAGLSGGGSVTLGGSITINSDGLLSSSAQIASDISGSFTATSSSFSTRVTANEIITAKTLVSSSAQIALDISGSFVAPSASFSTRVTLNDAKVTNSDQSLVHLAVTGSDVLFGHITASGNISSSGTVTANAFVGNITGDLTGEADTVATIAGLAPNTATTQATQGAITSLGTLSALTVSGDITANGNIVGDDGTDITNIESIFADNLIHDGDTDTKIVFGTNTVSIKAGNTSVFESSVTGSVLSKVHQNVYDTGSLAISTANGAMGDIVKFGGTTTTAGGVYFLNSSGGWTLTQANAATTSTGSLAVAVGTNSTTHGMCLRGFVNPFTDPSAGIGSPLYLSDTHTGRMLAAPPSDTNDVVRIVGYQYGPDLIYFNPSNDFIIHA